MDDLAQRIWQIDAESGWSAEEVEEDDRGIRRLRSYLTDILNELCKDNDRIKHAYAAICGVKCGWFQPVASVGRILEDIALTRTYGDSNLVSKFLHTSKPLQIISRPASQEQYCGDPSIQEKALIRLCARGELYGFISLDSMETGAFSGSFLEQLEAALPVLSRTVADALFSFRLRQLGAPFRYVERDDSLQLACEHIVDRTARGFGADGVVLRLLDPTYGYLVNYAHEGEIADSLLADKRPDEGVCGRVYTATGYPWAIGMSDDDPAHGLQGVNIQDGDIQRLRELGAHSFIVMRLSSEVSDHAGSIHVGTLSFYYRRPHRFSWRDIALFRSFCQRVADYLSLFQKKIELEEAGENLRLQSARLTQIEIVALLAHDLSHKTFESCLAVNDYIDRCRKEMNNKKERRTHDHLEPFAQLATEATLQVQKSLQQVKSLSIGENTDLEHPGRFSLADVLKQVQDTLKGALARNKLTIETVLRGNLELTGHRNVLEQAFYNLVINSIEAARTRRNIRPSTIHIHAHDDRGGGGQRKISIQFWDGGPGINQSLFPNPQEIFEIGKTSKQTGTGTGLPVTRSLIGRHFSGSLALEDPSSARFQLLLQAENTDDE